MTILSILFFILALVTMLYKKANYIYLLPVFIVIIDTLFFEITINNYNYTDVKSVLIGIFVIFTFALTNFRGYKLNLWIFAFIALSIFKILFDTDNIIRSLLSFSNIAGSMLIFLAGYNFIRTKSELHKLNNISIILLVVFVLNFILSNILSFGMDAYDLNIYGGYLTVERSFFAAIIIFIVPYYLIKVNNKRKILVSIIWVLSILIILILLRRSAIVIALVGLVIVHIFYIYDVKLLLNRLLPALALLILLVLLNLDIINDYKNMFEMRGRSLDRELDEQLMAESRILEIILVTYETFNFNDIKRSLIGDGYFYTNQSIGIYADGYFGDRPMHTFLAQILHYTGILGFFIYAMIHLKFIRLYFTIRKKHTHDKSANMLKYIYLALLFTMIFSNYTKGFNTESFNILFYLYLGSIYSILSSNNSIE